MPSVTCKIILHFVVFYFCPSPPPPLIKTFPYIDLKCFIMVLKISADLSENVSEGALGKWCFLKPQVSGSSRAGCQCGALEDHVKWVFWFCLVFCLGFLLLYYFLISCHRALLTSHENQLEASLFVETCHWLNLAAINVLQMDMGSQFSLAASYWNIRTDKSVQILWITEWKLLRFYIKYCPSWEEE